MILTAEKNYSLNNLGLVKTVPPEGMSGTALAAGRGNGRCPNPQANAKRLTINFQIRSLAIIAESLGEETRRRTVGLEGFPLFPWSEYRFPADFEDDTNFLSRNSL